MRLIYLLFLLFISADIHAQICGTSKNNAGEISRYAMVQFGKDTIVMGAPFKIKDKPGMSFDFSTIKNNTNFVFVLRLSDSTLIADSIKVDSSYLLLTMNNSDTLKIMPLKALRSPYGLTKSSGAIMISLRSYFNLERLTALAQYKLIDVKYYLNEDTYINLPVTTLEADKLKIAVGYLLR
ncbi:hypothetical protein SAMN05216490_2305 [Mucilaginibacter mallensis]|uniref:Outer membrane lipoprotein-sorting protein n=1 Tax=Mucilaginibacter mallensis TaxID=652787 RepID=A0A1H1WZ67_MUCMA|nr:hypothetical protein [Mucilaginibacter mallensis]SDT01706.1 hypothetical protein SAMN05216490_2305 [Mucilaginibacter mallensis]